MNIITPLFPSVPLLEHRLGSGQFAEIPQEPGIYRFYDARGDLLYVGKAKNLRTRLFSYKRARAGQVSRKVARLIGRIASFDYEITETEKDALLLENRWIRRERPSFNHANKQTEAYYFVYFKPEERGLEFRLAMRIHEETDENLWYGCFKGHGPVRQSLGCLLQLLWMAEHRVTCPMHLPVQLTRRLTPMRYHLPWAKPSSPIKQHDVSALLHAWMRGESCELLDWLAVHLDDAVTQKKTPFQVRHFEQCLDCLKTFYDRKLVVHRFLRDGRDRIGQEEIDDELIRFGM